MQVKQLKKEECRKILRRKQLGRIACSYDNQPYIVPINFVYDGEKNLYASSLVGQKIKWMRENPLVCIEVDEINGQNDWKTIIIFGKFEELPDTPEFEDHRVFARELLSKFPVEKQISDGFGINQKSSENKTVFYRIGIKKITGHKKSPAMRAMFFETSDFNSASRGRAWGCDKIL
jgi:nitroimidazol reductase NimA-like FMN-containing flavoprotein (pyridoxamine 5'-phosphate oxidase superfamily)